MPDQTAHPMDDRLDSLERQDEARGWRQVSSLAAPGERILAFARGRIAGGWRGRMHVGPEAFVAPFVNVALTDRRLLLQHIRPGGDRGTQANPHSIALGAIRQVRYATIETFGAEPAARLIVDAGTAQHIRLRFRGARGVRQAQAVASVFSAITGKATEPDGPEPLTRCTACGKGLAAPSPFCPYCGASQQPTAPSGAAGTDSSTFSDMVRDLVQKGNGGEGSHGDAAGSDGNWSGSGGAAGWWARSSGTA